MGVHKLIPIDEIDLDLGNPRIARFLEIYGTTPSAQQIAFALREGVADDDSNETSTTFRSLKESIRTNGGLINPIIVNKTKSEHVVIEGNTRLAIYKEFQERGVEGNWSEIPCLVHEDMSDKEIDGIRLQAHLVGVRPWDPYSKAKYLSKLRNEKHLTWSEIVDFCGGKKEEASRYIAAYEDMEEYYRPLVDDTDFDTTRFSGFVEYQKKNIKDALIRHGFDSSDFAKWVKSNKLFPLNTVRKLPIILDNPQAKELFLKKDAKAALKVLDSPITDVNFESISIKELAKILTKKLRVIEGLTMREYKADSNHPEYQALLDLKVDLDDTIDMVEGN
jgi:hypothetical protein